MKRIIIIITITFLAGCVIWLSSHPDQSLPNELLTYYQKNAFTDTGATNIVTAIYLNYRMFDTLFEALMLFISVLGIIYFSRHEGGKNES